MQRMFINAAVCNPTETDGEFQFVVYKGGNIAENYHRSVSLDEAQAELERLAAKYGWPPMMMDKPYLHRPARLANFGE